MADSSIPNFQPSTTTGSLGSSDLPNTLATIGTHVLQILLLLGAIIAVLNLVNAGYRYISAGGDSEKTKVARMAILNSIIGVVIMSLAFTLVHFGITLGGIVNHIANNAFTAKK